MENGDRVIFLQKGARRNRKLRDPSDGARHDTYSTDASITMQLAPRSPGKTRGFIISVNFRENSFNAMAGSTLRVPMFGENGPQTVDDHPSSVNFQIPDLAWRCLERYTDCLLTVSVVLSNSKA